ncbi:hypothetical protein RCIP0075_00024 [Klebsiella phage RCIP0075]
MSDYALVCFLVAVAALNARNAWDACENDRPGLFGLSVLGLAIAALSIGVGLVRMGVVA